jgi:hypothetical protein
VAAGRRYLDVPGQHQHRLPAAAPLLEQHRNVCLQRWGTSGSAIFAANTNTFVFTVNQTAAVTANGETITTPQLKAAR